MAVTQIRLEFSYHRISSLLCTSPLYFSWWPCSWYSLGSAHHVISFLDPLVISQDFLICTPCDFMMDRNHAVHHVTSISREAYIGSAHHVTSMVALHIMSQVCGVCTSCHKSAEPAHHVTSLRSLHIMSQVCGVCTSCHKSAESARHVTSLLSLHVMSQVCWVCTPGLHIMSPCLVSRRQVVSNHKFESHSFLWKCDQPKRVHLNYEPEVQLRMFTVSPLPVFITRREQPGTLGTLCHKNGGMYGMLFGCIVNHFSCVHTLRATGDSTLRVTKFGFRACERLINKFWIKRMYR